MTPEQITMILQIIADLPTTAIYIAMLYVLYRDNMKVRLETGAWMVGQLGNYMERDRQIVSDAVPKPKVEIASKYAPPQQ